jgi:hypothetical protein
MEKNMALTPEQTARVQQLRDMIAPYLNSDPSTAAGMLRDVPEVRKYGLWELCYDLDHATYGCHKNDVIGVIDLIEKSMENENE